MSSIRPYARSGFTAAGVGLVWRLARVPEKGELEKIDTQWADNRKVVDRVGACLGEELSDGLSAWKRSLRRLLERAESGESDGVVVWHTDRLFRQPRNLEKLIQLGERGFKVCPAHGERDLADPDDRFIMRIEVAHTARSSDDRPALGVLDHAEGPPRLLAPGLMA